MGPAARRRRGRSRAWPPRWRTNSRATSGRTLTARSGRCGMAASNDTNQPQVLHTSTAECTDRTCLMPGPAPAGGLRPAGPVRHCLPSTFQCLSLVFRCRSTACHRPFTASRWPFRCPFHCGFPDLPLPPHRRQGDDRGGKAAADRPVDRGAGQMHLNYPPAGGDQREDDLSLNMFCQHT